jgi:hypothetical protein
MDQLASEFVQNLALGEIKKNVSTSAAEAGLRLEIVSAKNLAMPLESREVMQGLQVSVLFRKKHVRSESILCNTTDPLINFSADFNVTKEKLLVDDSLIMIYLSLAPTRAEDQVRCGIESCCRSLGTCPGSKIHRGLLLHVQPM